MSLGKVLHYGNFSKAYFKNTEYIEKTHIFELILYRLIKQIIPRQSQTLRETGTESHGSQADSRVAWVI